MNNNHVKRLVERIERVAWPKDPPIVGVLRDIKTAYSEGDDDAAHAAIDRLDVIIGMAEEQK